MNENREWAILLVVLFFVIFFMVFAITSLYPAEIHGFFRFGKTLENDWAVAELEMSFDHNIWRFENSLYGGWETWMVYGGKSSYPFKDIYHVGYRAVYKPIYVEIEHFCNHPVYSTYNADWWNVNQRSGNALTTVSIGVEW